MRERIVAHIALGSNLGDREANIREALRLLPDDQVLVREVSDLLETAPVGPGEQGMYLNAAATLWTGLSAAGLLDHLLSVERRLGRERRREERWGPRIIDLDLLLFGDQVINRPGLVVPHPRMHERAFVLAPLVQIAPDATHPTLGKTVRTLWQECQSAAP